MFKNVLSPVVYFWRTFILISFLNWFRFRFESDKPTWVKGRVGVTGRSLLKSGFLFDSRTFVRWPRLATKLFIHIIYFWLHTKITSESILLYILLLKRIGGWNVERPVLVASMCGVGRPVAGISSHMKKDDISKVFYWRFPRSSIQ